MDIFTISLFGHREIDNIFRLEDKLYPVIRELMKEKHYVAFLVGRNGEFDKYAASVIKSVQREVGKEKSDITLVLPYEAADIEYYEKYYDGIIIPDIVYDAHPKNAITLRNRWMIEQSDMVIVYVEQAKGGAYTSMKYAKKMNKNTINIGMLELT